MKNVLGPGSAHVRWAIHEEILAKTEKSAPALNSISFFSFPQQKSRASRLRAFTLIELITVLAIASVLLALIIIPLVQSFNFTRAAQAFADAQERARVLISSISREISNSTGVRDNAGTAGELAVVVPGQNGTREGVIIPNAKLDVTLPAEGDPNRRAPDGTFLNDDGRADPTREYPEGQILLPVVPGTALVRYYIALRNPLAANGVDPGLYNNPYDGILMRPIAGQDNLYVLRRAVYVPVRNVAGTLQVNTDLFVDDNNDGVPDDMDDPYFMVQDPPGQPLLSAPERAAKALRIQHWLEKSTIITEFSRYDMIEPIINKRTRLPIYDGNVPRLRGLIQFKPTPVTNEPGSGQSVLPFGTENDSPESLASDVYVFDNGAWSSPIIRIFPTGYNPTDVDANDYLITRFDARAGARSSLVYRYDPDADTDRDDRNGEGDPADDYVMFDIKTFENFTSSGFAFPWTRGANAAFEAGRPDWRTMDEVRRLFKPFYTDPRSGKVFTSFPIDAVGVDVPAGTPATSPPNLPTANTGPAITPTTDTTTGGNFYDYTEVNRLFNKVWNDRPELRPGVHRFVDLRVCPSADGSYSPLFPDTGVDPEIGYPNARIVPGSEQVFGPDQNPGPNYGQRIRYTRTTRVPSANQYRINYTDLAEPTDYTLLGLSPAEVATFNGLGGNYDYTNFISAVIQPRFKAGYLWLNSDPNVPLPVGQIEVFYKFQFMRPGDTVTVDYDTRQVMSVLLTIRNYPQASIPNPQAITLEGTAAVRNFVR